MPFNKEDSIALKGIAILMMMLHHNFRASSLFDNYQISFSPFTEQQIVNIAYACKICVSMYAFITGYGLFLSYSQNKQSASRWVKRTYIKTFSGYWFVWVLSTILCQIINGRSYHILFKGGLCSGAINTVIDFFGLHNLFQTPSINGTWWYMSAALVFIVLMPIVYRFKENLFLVLIFPAILIRVIFSGHGDAAFTGSNSVYAFLTPYLLGCIFAKYNLFARYGAFCTCNTASKLYKLCLEVWCLIFLYKVFHRTPVKSFWEIHYGLFPMLFILICVEYILPLEHIRKILVFCGQHSMNVFLVHTFIRGYYLADFTYSWKHFIPVCLVLFIMSVCISMILEKLKKLTGYNTFIRKVIESG